jgi:dolichyl-phosphate beta-glucosyltransferase
VEGIALMMPDPSSGRPTDFSVVIPAFNEARRLPESLARLQRYLSTYPGRSEVIVADDGSADETAAVVREWMRRWPALRLVELEHRGKGSAVRAGVLAASGTLIAIADADFSMPPEEFDQFVATLRGDYDLAIGSREAPGARRYDEPQHRHVMGRVFNKFVQVMLLPGLEDTQCGFKCMRREVAHDLCREQTIEGWGYDVELLYIAAQRQYRICEVPVSWYFVRDSRVHPIRDTLTMVRDVLRIRANSRRGCYAGETVRNKDVSMVR